MMFYEFEAMDIRGNRVGMDKYQGKLLLIVNTASKCGLTPQFEGLETLYKEYKEKGLEILGFPCNQFANQDPGSNEEVQEYCQLNYGVSFPMFGKVEVNGTDAHPIYQFLKSKAKGFMNNDIKWNFTKFLVDNNGTVIKRYGPTVKPDKIKKDIEKLLPL